MMTVGFIPGTTAISTYTANQFLPANRRLKIVNQDKGLVDLAGAGEADIGINYREVSEGQFVGIRPHDDFGIMLAEPVAAILPTQNSVTPDGGNTGNGTAASIPNEQTLVGSYVVECNDATTVGAEKWTLTNPNETILTTEIITGVTYSHQEIGIDMTASTTDFVVGDKFTISIIFNDVIYGAADGKISTSVSGNPIGTALERISTAQGGYIAIKRA